MLALSATSSVEATCFLLYFCLDAKVTKNQDAFRAIASHRYLPDLLAFSAGGIDLAWHFPGYLRRIAMRKTHRNVKDASQCERRIAMRLYVGSLSNILLYCPTDAYPVLR
jgi:hypothetical protein